MTLCWRLGVSTDLPIYAIMEGERNTVSGGYDSSKEETCGHSCKATGRGILDFSHERQRASVQMRREEKYESI